MTNQPYEGAHEGRPYEGRYEGRPYEGRPYEGPYEGQYGDYDPYRQQPDPQQPQPPYRQQPWPGHPQGPGDPHAAEPHTQQWQGQTWETRVQPPVSAEETAYLPPQGPDTGPHGQQPHGGHGTGHHAAHASHGHDAYAQAEPQGYGVRRQPQPQPQHAQPYQQPPASAPGAGGGEAPSYGPATVAGNPRITDAQRARAEGRSPIIDPGMQPALLTALLGLLLSGAAAIGTYALLVPLVLLQAVTSAGWFRLNGMWPARQGIALGFAGALAADAALLVSDRSPAAILGTLGVWVLLALVLQLRSHADPDERMYGLMATVAAAALAIVAGGWLAADADAVSAGAVAVAVAVLARALPLPTPASVVAALLAAAGAGIAVGRLTDLGASGALLGAGAAACALIGHRVAAYDYPSRFVHFTAGVALPLAASAPAVYVLGRALG
ncbi:hypothetical protein AB0M97_17455 [Streptomyces sp. NPDC051207]|uniref:hypothetical protein n=1 Tax=Streptomyces sp. NPDC051207 TaxID=3154641 RepID=UPI003422DC2B